eukprot:scaffold22672_cov141-Cylindrotheca_fusiformis.AAC.8
MALRRPPTRVELKADDIEEYNEIMREREMVMKESNTPTTGRYAGSRPRGAKPGTSTQRKQAAADRIGIGQPGR